MICNKCKVMVDEFETYFECWQCGERKEKLIKSVRSVKNNVKR